MADTSWSYDSSGRIEIGRQEQMSWFGNAWRWNVSRILASLSWSSDIPSYTPARIRTVWDLGAPFQFTSLEGGTRETTERFYSCRCGDQTTGRIWPLCRTHSKGMWKLSTGMFRVGYKESRACARFNFHRHQANGEILVIIATLCDVVERSKISAEQAYVDIKW